MTEDVVLSTISRVLCVSWTDRTEATVFLQHTADSMKESRQEDPAMPVNVQVNRFLLVTLHPACMSFPLLKMYFSVTLSEGFGQSSTYGGFGPVYLR